MWCWILTFIFLTTSVIASDSRRNDPKETIVHSEGMRFRRSTGIVEKSYSFNSKEQNAAVTAHNEARSSVKPSAANMKEMKWDEDLARLATDYAQKCIYKHNEDRSKGKKYVGENLYISKGIPYSKSYIYGAVKNWDSEKFDYNYPGTSCSPSKVCGHYTQVVWANSLKVGCGAALCSSVVGISWSDAILMVCNYSPGGNYQGQKPYKQGPPCSNCDDGYDTCNNNLCSSKTAGGVPTTSTTTATQKYDDQWSSWSQCSQTCGTGYKSRSRTCSSGVSACNDKSHESKSCNTDPCPTKPSKEWGPWESWGQCSKSCGYGKRIRIRTCPAGVTPCLKKSHQTGSCNIKPCSSPDSNMWGPWGNWGRCSATCGYGKKTRSRYCPAGETPYLRRSDQTNSCILKQCVATAFHKWGPWSHWGRCSATCGYGKKTRSRYCPAGETPCLRRSDQTNSCILKQCVATGFDFLN